MVSVGRTRDWAAGLKRECGSLKHFRMLRPECLRPERGLEPGRESDVGNETTTEAEGEAKSGREVPRVAGPPLFTGVGATIASLWLLWLSIVYD